MIETLKYIGRWFIRFILIAIIFSTFQSCAKAYTFEQLLEYCSVLRTYEGASNDQKNLANWVLNNQNTIRSRIGNDINDFDSWQIDKMTYSRGGTRIMGYQGGTFNGWNQKCVVKNYTKGIAITQADGYFSTYRGTSIPNNLNYMSSNSYCGLLAQNIAENVNFTGKLWNNIYNPLKPLEFDNFLNNSAYNGNLWTYYFQGDFYSYNRLKIGDIVTNDSYYFEVRLRDSQTNIVLGTSFVALNTEPNTFYNDSAIYINEDFEVYTIPRLLNYSTQYQLEITSYYGDGDTNLQEDIDWFIFLPQNAIVSGDVISTLGSGDFTNQNATNQIIDNQQQQQEDNQSFLDNLYNQMFTVSGEQVQQIVNTTMNHIQIPSGEIAEIEQIFNYLSGDAGDFVISWTDKTTHFTVNGANISQMTIPARQINFSEMERQSPELQQAMHWARLITNISIFSILIHEAYICLLATLGVPVAIYGQKLEEKQQLAKQQQKQEQAWQNRLEQQRYNDWLYSHRKR